MIGVETLLQAKDDALKQDVAEQQSVKAKNSFASSKAYITLNEKNFMLRILKMHGSTLIFISHADSECLNEMAVAMPMPSESSKAAIQTVGTTIIGEPTTTASQRLAEQLSRRFKRQFIVSYNVNLDVIMAPLFDVALAEYIRTHIDAFV